MDNMEGAIPIEQFQPAQSEASSNGPIPIDQFQPATPEGAIPVDQFESQDEHYGTGSQQAIAGLEGIAQGIAGPIATLAETKLLGVNPEDIAGREKANPWTHRGGEAIGLVGGLMSGVGELAGIAKSAELIANTAKFGKLGSMALKGALEAAALQGSDEISHAITNYDPNQTAASALAHMGYAGIMGTLTGGLFGLGDITSNTGIKALEDSKVMNRSEEYLAGIGFKHSESPVMFVGEEFRPLASVPEGASAMFKAGYKAAGDLPHTLPNFVINKGIDNVADLVGGTIGGSIGGTLGGAPGAVLGTISGARTTRAYIDPIINKVLRKPLTTFSQKYVMPPVMKVLTSNQIQALPSAIMYGLKAAKGAKLMDKALDSIFIPGEQQAFSSIIDAQTKARINQNIEDSVLDKQMHQSSDQTPQFAEGGIVQTGQETHFATAFPVENGLLQASKTRVYNHLKMLKPREKQGFAFDHKAPTKEQERVYDQALDIATNPLYIVKHLKNGSLSSSHIIQMNQMWPELNDQLRKKVTERITKMQLEGKKPPYKIRQGLALLLGTPLDSVMTPQGILAAQSAFQGNQSAGQQSGLKTEKGSKSSPALQKAPQSYKTPDQAAEADSAVRK